MLALSLSSGISAYWENHVLYKKCGPEGSFLHSKNAEQFSSSDCLIFTLDIDRHFTEKIRMVGKIFEVASTPSMPLHRAIILPILATRKK